MPHVARVPGHHGVADVVGTERDGDAGRDEFVDRGHGVVHRADLFGARRVDPGGRAGDHHDVGFLHAGVETFAVLLRVRGDRNPVNGDDAALHAVLNRLVAELFGFVFERFVELVDVDVDHLVVALRGFENDVERFVALAVVAFVALRKRADDVDHFGADVEPLARFGMNHALEGLVRELDRELVLVVFAGADAGLDRAVFGLD